MNVADLPILRLHTDAVMTALREIQVAGTDLDVRDNTQANNELKPLGWQGTPGESLFVPYAIVYPQAGSTFDGTLDAPDVEVWWPFQVTSVGNSVALAQLLSDLVRVRLQPSNITIPNRHVNRIIPQSGGVRPDTTEDPPLFFAPDAYRMWTTPA